MDLLALPIKQRGLSLSNLLAWSAVLIFVVISALKIAPVYYEHMIISKSLIAIAKEASTQNMDLNQIRAAILKRVQVDNITSINSNDIKIQKEQGRVVLMTNYTVKIPVIANISLTIDFRARSE